MTFSGIEVTPIRDREGKTVGVRLRFPDDRPVSLTPTQARELATLIEAASSPVLAALLTTEGLLR